MNDKIYNIITKKYSSFIKTNNKNIDLGTYYNLYDNEFNFLERFDVILKLFEDGIHEWENK